MAALQTTGATLRETVGACEFCGASSGQVSACPATLPGTIRLHLNLTMRAGRTAGRKAATERAWVGRMSSSWPATARRAAILTVGALKNEYLLNNWVG